VSEGSLSEPLTVSEGSKLRKITFPDKESNKMSITYILSKSDKDGFLWSICPKDSAANSEIALYFGDPTLANYPGNKDSLTRTQYLRFHKMNSHVQFIHTPEFWERWILFNKSTIKGSVEDVERRFDIRIEGNYNRSWIQRLARS
jgi:hypothetical protein